MYNTIDIKIISQNLTINSLTQPPFEAVENITANGPLTINGNTTYKAGQSILLIATPGNPINIPSQSVFLAKIEGCN
ncbi:MAG: hypothetical protein R2822_05075 [Spirosomataceae bacterium]